MRRDMSRVIGLLMTASLLAVAVAGCAKLPPGTDGNLSNSWPQISEPQAWAPEAGTCHKSFAPSVSRASYAPVACTTSHDYETVYVGAFTGAAASRTSPPLGGSAELGAAWSECDTKVSEFVGGEWRHGKIWVGVTVPSSAAWAGGVRWFRCEIAEVDELNGDEVSRSTTAKNAFAIQPGIKYGCSQYENKKTVVVACSQYHNAEFVGIYTPAVNYDQVANLDNQIANECRKVIASFAGLGGDTNMQYRTGVMWEYPTQTDWEAGDHGIRCHLWLGTRHVTRSLAGTGNSGLPINYA